MATLHLVSRSPYESNALMQCLDRAGFGDTVLLIEHGVYAALADAAVCHLLAMAAPRLGGDAICVLRPDLEARGIALDEVRSTIQLLEYDSFVDLAARHSRILSWF
ncbi:MAG: sulfurtransferase complex subunit TusB [Comamonadaceae bacterium]|nr:sulfurtransferase complex subunit TusB [Comamonadaceae bacterium]